MTALQKSIPCILEPMSGPCCVRAEELRKCSGKEMKSKQENEWGKTEK
ncbi:hypothetical protein K070079E91_10260 [Eisenbergiella porci]